MSVPTNHQVINYNGRPVAVIVPYEEYLSLFPSAPEESTTPQEVMVKCYVEGKSLIQSWREHLNLTQEEVAGRMGVTQAAYQQMEKKSARPRKTTREKIADAFGIDSELLNI